MNANTIAVAIEVEEWDSWDDIWAEGIWFRVQPKGLGLDHRSETSNGALAAGVHVFQTLEQAVAQEGRWCMTGGGHEVIVIRGPKHLEDTGDVEGCLLPSGCGEIVLRADFDTLCDEYGN